MKYLLALLFCCSLAVPMLRAQDPKGFEGAWIGSFVHDNQAPRTWTYVFENIHDGTCTGYMWNGTRHYWTKCEIKDGQITVYWGTETPTVTGKIISPTELELGWHAKTEIHTFKATKQSDAYLKSLVDPTEMAGVDRSHMGIYRALAEMVMDNMKKGDMVTAVKLCRIIEVAWDRAETDLQKSAPKTWGGIDGAMDNFIQPIMGYKKTPPDPAKVAAAYHTYQDKLKEAEAADTKAH